MQERRRDKGGAVIALLMIGLGAWYLAGQFFAPLRAAFLAGGLVGLFGAAIARFPRLIRAAAGNRA